MEKIERQRLTHWIETRASAMRTVELADNIIAQITATAILETVDYDRQMTIDEPTS